MQMSILLQRSFVQLFVLFVAICFSLPSQAVDLNKRQMFEIAPQPITSALLQFATQTKIQLISSNVDIKMLKSPGVNGEFTLAAALDRLLSGTGLRYRAEGDETIVVVAAEVNARSSETGPLHVAQSEASSVNSSSS